MGKKLAEILEDCRVTVQNAQADNDIKLALAPFGYTDEELQGGETLYQDTLALFAAQSKEQQDVREINDSFFELREQAENEYTRICKLARVAFRQNTALQDLIPSVLTYTPFDDWKLSAYKMYDNLKKNNKATALLTRYGVTEEVLQACMDELDALEQLKSQRSIEEGEAQQATQDRNAKMEELKDYCRDLIAISKIALSDKPQLLEKLGVLVRA
ncbi:hypothetical protein ACUNWD_08985 [Sunxiuqinia sp. A32]|uniref:hypothetical protein n=1 Tax=Sunxiuqinia sp. A32 TaxID=3461496 RepID=UPI0040465B9A